MKALILAALTIGFPSDVLSSVFVIEEGPVHIGDTSHQGWPGCYDSPGSGPCFETLFHLTSSQAAVLDLLHIEVSKADNGATILLNGQSVGTNAPGSSAACNWKGANYNVAGMLIPGTNSIRICALGGPSGSGYDNQLISAIELVGDTPSYCEGVQLVASLCVNHVESSAQRFHEFLGIPLPGRAEASAFQATFTHAITSPRPITRVDQVVGHVDSPLPDVIESLSARGNDEYSGTIGINWVNDVCLLLETLGQALTLLAAGGTFSPAPFFQPAPPPSCGPNIGPDPHFEASRVNVYIEGEPVPCELSVAPECADFPPYSETLASSILECYLTPDCWGIFGGVGPHGVKSTESAYLVGVEAASGGRTGTIDGVEYSSLEGVLIDESDLTQFAGALSEPFVVHVMSPNAGSADVLLELGFLQNPSGVQNGFYGAYRIPAMSVAGRARLSVDGSTSNPPLEYDSDGDGVFETKITPEVGAVTTDNVTWGSLKARY